MKKKIRVGIIFGGKSAEHEVSLQSAKSIIDSIDKKRYELVLIGIDKAGRWHLNESVQPLLNVDNPKLIALNHKYSTEIGVLPGNSNFQLVNLGTMSNNTQLDVIFPVLHGTNGEDGTIQGLLKLLNLPFVGCSILGSAVGMDKDVQKRLLKEANIPIAKFLTFHKGDNVIFNKVKKSLKLPIFIKPANAGSSIGVTKVEDDQLFKKAIIEAFKYDTKILIEEGIQGREIECSVLGNENPVASLPGEVIPSHTFYSYEAKYIDEKGAILEIPAKLSQKTIKKVQNLAIKTFKALCCDGMARVDMFLKDDGSILVNEINTIPGFTKISMYPKLWQVSGLSYPKLIDKLIQLAFQKFNKDNQLKTIYPL